MLGMLVKHVLDVTAACAVAASKCSASMLEVKVLNQTHMKRNTKQPSCVQHANNLSYGYGGCAHHQEHTETS